MDRSDMQTDEIRGQELEHMSEPSECEEKPLNPLEEEKEEEEERIGYTIFP